jgi:hypothetical protein
MSLCSTASARRGYRRSEASSVTAAIAQPDGCEAGRLDVGRPGVRASRGCRSSGPTPCPIVLSNSGAFAEDLSKPHSSPVEPLRLRGLRAPASGPALPRRLDGG